MSILKTEKINIRTKIVRRDKKGHFIMPKKALYQEDKKKIEDSNLQNQRSKEGHVMINHIATNQMKWAKSQKDNKTN